MPIISVIRNLFHGALPDEADPVAPRGPAPGGGTPVPRRTSVLPGIVRRPLDANEIAWVASLSPDDFALLCSAVETADRGGPDSGPVFGGRLTNRKRRAIQARQKKEAKAPVQGHVSVDIPSGQSPVHDDPAVVQASRPSVSETTLETPGWPLRTIGTVGLARTRPAAARSSSLLSGDVSAPRSAASDVAALVRASPLPSSRTSREMLGWPLRTIGVVDPMHEVAVDVTSNEAGGQDRVADDSLSRGATGDAVASAIPPVPSTDFLHGEDSQHDAADADAGEVAEGTNDRFDDDRRPHVATPRAIEPEIQHEPAADFEHDGANFQPVDRPSDLADGIEHGGVMDDTPPHAARSPVLAADVHPHVATIIPTPPVISQSPVADSASGSRTRSPERSVPSAPSRRKAARPKLSDRAKSLVSPMRISQEPAIQLAGNWEQDVAPRICRAFVDSEIAHHVSNVSTTGLARMKALEFERKYPGKVPKTQRLLPEGAGKSAYYDAQVRAFLEAVGERDPDAVMESFKKAGMGSLHRHHVNVLSALNGILGCVGILDPEPVSKAAISGVRLGVSAATAGAVHNSGKRRFVLSGTEDLMPDLRVDASPGAKRAANVLRTSADVVRELVHARKNMRQLAAAEAAVADARQAVTGADTPQTRQALQEAINRMTIAFARHCFQAELKQRHKDAVGSAAVEFRGAQRNLVLNTYIGSGIGIPAGVVSILTPKIVAAHIGGPIAGAAVAAIGLLYIGYQLSAGPSKDGEAKAKRAIVALGKSSDMLGVDKTGMQRECAAAYEDYLAARSKARSQVRRKKLKLKLPPRAERQAISSATAGEAARAELLARVNKIAGKYQVDEELDSEENWRSYQDYSIQCEAAKASGAADGGVARIAELTHAFEAKHSAKFNPGMVNEALKTPWRVRLDNSRSLLAGRVAHGQRELRRFESGVKKNDASLPPLVRNARKQGLQATLKMHLLDLFNLEMAMLCIKPAVAAKDDAHPGIAVASAALGAVQDPKVRDLFCGDGRRQVDALRTAKKMRIGEEEKYVKTVSASNTLGIAINFLSSTGNLTYNLDRAIHPEIHSIVQDWNDGNFIQQGGFAFSAPFVAGDRTSYAKQAMPAILKPLARKGKSIEVKASVEGKLPAVFGLADKKIAVAVDSLVQQMSRLDGVPDKVSLTIGSTTFQVKLDGTTDYYKQQYNNASLSRKAAYELAQAREVGRQVGVSLAAGVMQPIATLVMATNRKPMARSEQRSREVRKELARNAGAVPSTSTTSAASMPSPTSDLLAGNLRGAAMVALSIPWVGEDRSAPRAEGMAIVTAPAPRWQVPDTGQALRAAHYESEHRHELAGLASQSRAWFAGHGILLAKNSSSGMNCFVMQALQHAHGRYDTDFSDEAQALREEIVADHPEVDEGDRMLYPDEPAVLRLLELVRERTGVLLDLHIVQPGIDGPVRVQSADNGGHPVGVFFNGTDHFEAMYAGAGFRPPADVGNTSTTEGWDEGEGSSPRTHSR